MVRMVVGVVVLLVAAFVLLNLGRRQAEALQGLAAAKAASGAAASAPPRGDAGLPQQMQQDVQRALQQGAAQRASDANP